MSEMITWDGRTKPLAHWSFELSIPYSDLVVRLRSGWSVDRAFTTPGRRFAVRTYPQQGDVK